MMVTVIDDELLVVQLNGNFDAAALQRLARELIEIERVRPVSKRIVFTEEVAAASITADEITYAMGGTEPAVSVQTAFVVSNEFQYGIARMFQSVLETKKQRIEIFRDLEAAGQWLKFDLMLLSKYAGDYKLVQEEGLTSEQRIW